MKLGSTRFSMFAITAVSVAGLALLSACSGIGTSAGAESSTVTDPATPATGGTMTVAPTGTVVSNIPFPLDPAPTTPSQGASNSVAGSTGTIPGQRHRDGEGEGRDHEEGGEFGERSAIQRVTVSLTSAGVQLSAATVNHGPIEFDLVNQTNASQRVLISGNGVNGDSGEIAAGATVHLQGTLDTGVYQVGVAAGNGVNNAPTATLTVQ